MATKTSSAVRTANATTDSHAAAAIDNSEAMAPPAKRQRIGDLQDSNGKRCYMAYLDKCKTRDNTAADFDLNGANAVEMLRNNECNSRIFLGIWVDEFEVLLKCLPDLMKGRDEVLVQQLKEITDSHFN
ncbi:hypothetical protein H4S04_002367 [Coemansia sp. S16]|nr:hypothetical protein H4S04_002367 [Coemansia sp. S16]